MIFAKSTEYSLKSLAYMAHQRDREFFGVRELADTLNLSTSYLAKILQKLTRGGLLKSVTGPRGGFGLQKDPEKIRVYDVVELMDDSSSVKTCVLGWSECGDKNPCPFHAGWKEFREQLIAQMKELTVAGVSREFWPRFRV